MVRTTASRRLDHDRPPLQLAHLMLKLATRSGSAAEAGTGAGTGALAVRTVMALE
jgi:hypothetical protein